MQLNEPFKDLNAEYFARRTDYVAALASPDYVNVTDQLETPAEEEAKLPAYVNMDPQRQTAAYRASRAGQARPGVYWSRVAMGRLVTCDAIEPSCSRSASSSSNHIWKECAGPGLGYWRCGISYG